MSSIKTRITNVAVVAIIGISAPLATALAAAEDGKYRFKMLSQSGSCDGSPNVIVIQNGKISGKFSGSSGVVRLSGRVKSDGTFKGSLSGGLATFKGSLNGNSGKGSWSGVGACTGTFQVRKM